MRPWSPIPIEDCGEPLQLLPPDLLRMEPHPYMTLGAPYGASGNPFQLRLGVVQRLLDAQQRLIEHDPSLRLSIFDAWRPIAVQAFMVDHSIAELCRERGLEVRSGDAFDQVLADGGGGSGPLPVGIPPHRHPTAPVLLSTSPSAAAMERRWPWVERLMPLVRCLNRSTTPVGRIPKLGAGINAGSCLLK